MRAVIFAGTTEGRELAADLSKRGIDVTASVATPYGNFDVPNVSVHIGRLDKQQIKQFISGCDFVVDATHPYAAVVTQNIKAACGELDIRLIRLLRDRGNDDGLIVVPDIRAAAEYLVGTGGNIFVSTGSKELEPYTVIADYRQRLVVRALPTDEARAKCEGLGIKNVIYAKGPFDYEQNREHFKRSCAKYLVTKNSGAAGGFEPKIRAARELDMGIIVIDRPKNDDEGVSKTEVLSLVDKIIGESDVY